MLNWGWGRPHSEVCSSGNKISSWLYQEIPIHSNTDPMFASLAFVSLIEFYLPHLQPIMIPLKARTMFLLPNSSTHLFLWFAPMMSPTKMENNHVSCGWSSKRKKTTNVKANFSKNTNDGTMVPSSVAYCWETILWLNVCFFMQD